MSKCKCTVSQKVIGDGCSKCNPEYIIGMLKDEIAQLKAELVEATEMAIGQAKTLIEKDKRIAELERMWSVVFDGHAVYQACGDDRITPSLLSSFLDGVAKAGKEAVDRLREGELK